ncbi:MAG: SpoIIE family protein phosphatase [Desulfamplus sp.]|nr:SpoIIE family protein phosphatase [Desulfamplus sp.]
MFNRLSIKFKLIAAFLFMVFTVIAVFTMFFYTHERTMIRNEMIKRGNDVIKTFTQMTVTLFFSMDYITIADNAGELVKDSDIVSVSVIDDRGKILINTDQEGPREISLESFFQDVMASRGIQYRELRLKGHPVLEFVGPIIYFNKIAGFTRIRISLHSFEEQLLNRLFRIVLLAGVMSIFALVLAVLLLRLLNPLKTLVLGTQEITGGNLGYQIPVRAQDEIGELARHFNWMSSRLRSYADTMEQKVAARTEALEKVNAQLRQAKEQLIETKDALWGEMQLAKKIQTVLLPKRSLLRGYDIAVSLEPAEEVGGDYYDIISVAGYEWVVIGDVSGHGVASGLVMMMVQTAIHTVLNSHPETSPPELLCAVNHTIYNNIQLMDEEKHMTIVVMTLGKDGGFTFSGLHEDILMWRRSTGKVENIETDGMWVGIEPDISDMLPVKHLKMNIGDCMVLFTDGITEARRNNGDFFGDHRLVSMVEESGSLSAAQIHRNIMDALIPYNKLDDVTLLVIKRTG